jgi:ABC-type transporter Mla MlaB component
VLSGAFDTDDVDALCAELAPVANLTSPGTVQIDLSQLTGLSASALAVLVATLRMVTAQRWCDPMAELIPPDDAALRECLSSAGLRSASVGGDADVQAGVEVEPADGRGGAIFGVCEPFTDHNSMRAAVDATLTWLRGRQQLSWDAAFAFDSMFRDFAQNVLQHAETDEGAMAMRLRTEIDSLEFAVADRGIGIRRSLAKNTAFERLRDDSAAVSAALAPGRTSKPGRGRGMGLYFVKELLKDNGGSLTVRSGKARVGSPPERIDGAGLPSFGGTLITAIVRTDEPLTLKPVERLLERLGGLKSVTPAKRADRV